MGSLFHRKLVVNYLKKILVCAFLFCVLASLCRFSSYKVQLCYLLVCFAVACLLLFFRSKNRLFYEITRGFLVFGGFEVFGLIIMILLHFIIQNSSWFRQTGTMETGFFEQKNVMIIVPHEDDDINLAGGIIEEYVKGDSEVRVVFATNGDYSGLGELRLMEAGKALAQMGITHENITFLGYGDQWQAMAMDDGSVIDHIYNSTENVIWKSHYLKERTYGTGSYLPYHESTYTRNNYLNDMKSVILQYKPDVIYVNDYDTHADHRAVSLFFEEAMGHILAEQSGYTPIIYKGYCYGTAWNAVDDFMEVNMASTQSNESLTGSIYQWEDRIRIPVCSSAAVQLMSENSVYKALDCHISQYASHKAGSIINGDKVFWERRTDSILYTAQIKYKGNMSTQLNDFKLLDSSDVSDKAEIVPLAGVVIVEEGEPVCVCLSERRDIVEIYLYDNPSRKSNIINGYILFDTGDRVDFGALDASGGMSKIECNIKNTHAFNIVITETEGDAPGLSEIEAYSDAHVERDEYIKIMDEKGDFCYDYWTENS